MLSTEDSLPHTLRPRLDKAGADASKIKVLTGWVDEQAKERAFTLQYLDVLEEEIHRYQPRLVIIDPITAYMGKIDIHRANEVQELMGQLNRLADRTRCAIVCIRHPAKPGQHIGKVIHRGLGSVGFVGTARTALFAEQHPTRAGLALLGQSKSNMERLGRTQLFSKDQGTFEWCGVSRISAEVLGGTGRGPDPTAFLEAVFWLEDRLKDGLPQASAALGVEADEDGIAFRTLRRAKQAPQIRSIKRGPDPQGKEVWNWQLLSLPLIAPPATHPGPLGPPGPLDPLDLLGPLHTDQRDREDDQENVVGREGQEGQEGQVVWQTTACPHCHGTDFWTGAAGQLICVRCHPQPTHKRS
jgi:DNA repair protein RadA/Sms